MNEFKILDSSIWLAYLFDGQFVELIECDEKLFLSALSLFEIKRKLLNIKVGKKDVNSKIDFIKKRNVVLSVDGKIAEKASELSFEKGLPATDSIIYATALQNKLNLVSLDNDFRGLSNTEVFDAD